MNTEQITMKAENVSFPVQMEEKQLVELKTEEIKEIEVSEVRVSVNETRFARLKKSLRKRSVSIL